MYLKKENFTNRQLSENSGQLLRTTKAMKLNIIISMLSFRWSIGLNQNMVNDEGLYVS